MRNEQADLARTLRRIPKDIRLSMATREIVPSSAECCLVGWAIRESLAYANGRAADEYYISDAWRDDIDDSDDSNCGVAARLFGGTYQEWSAVYHGIAREKAFPDIERAFVQVVQEALR